MVEASIKEKIEKYALLLKEQDLPVSAIYLFGSRAKGTALPDSDIDLLVVSPIFDGDRLALAGKLWKAAWKIDARIEPVPVGERTFEIDHVTPLYEIVREEGIRVL